MPEESLNQQQILTKDQEPIQFSGVLPINEELVLIALTGNELYGLQIIDAFKTTSEGKHNISIGVLYPLLARLEKRGLISSRMENGSVLFKGGARRKFFKITKAGTFTLNEAQYLRNNLRNWSPIGSTTFA